MNYSLTSVSKNAKTGPIGVTYSSAATCPATCELKGNGCYAENGHVGMHWRKVTSGERGVDLPALAKAIRRLPIGTALRHNVAGDLPHNDGHIDGASLKVLISATKRVTAFTYTHHVPSPENLALIQLANSKGFTVNLSANSAAEAAALKLAHNQPTVTVLPMDAPNSQIVDGVRVVACPAEKSDKVTCASCLLCADADRDYVIGFRAHGSRKKAANIIASAA